MQVRIYFFLFSISIVTAFNIQSLQADCGNRCMNDASASCNCQDGYTGIFCEKCKNSTELDFDSNQNIFNFWNFSCGWMQRESM